MRPLSPAVRLRRRRAAAVLVVAVAIVAALGSGSLVSSSPTASSRSTASATSTASAAAAPPPAASGADRPRHEQRDALGEDGGQVPDGTTVFDDDVPGVAHLDPDLLRALRRAATDAGTDGVGFVVNSGWRSAAYQEHLLRDAIARYGSEAEASRWVARPSASEHVSGDAVDIGPTAAAAWLSEHGAAYGLCRVYGNEPWHFELRPDATGQGCPAMYADPTQDPRMQR